MKTLTELFVVIFVTGTLVLLALPAMNSHGTSSRTLQCQNHLKQLATAMQMHMVENTDRFPSGGLRWNYIGDTLRGNSAHPEDDDHPANQRGGWTYNLLDYLELLNLRNASIDTRYTTPVAFFYCPSRRPPCLYTTLARPDITSDDTVVSRDGLSAKSDYAANAGNCVNVQNERGTDDIKNGGGIIFHLSSVRGSDVTDGLQSTILLGEKNLDAAAYEEEKYRADDDDCYLGGRNWDTLRGFSIGRIYQDRFGYSDRNAFGSVHPNGVNFIFCDGHWTRMNFKISPETLRWLTCRNDGKQQPGT